MRTLFLLFASIALANTSVVDIKGSGQQATIHVHTDQAGSCTYIVSQSPTLSPVVNDNNSTLFPGSNSDSRTDAIISLTSFEHWYTVGNRYTDYGSDGNFYSRALAASTPHYGSVTCGSDAAVLFNFSTAQIQMGITRSPALRYDTRGLGNYALPTVNFASPTQLYIDPETGYQYRYMTGPGIEPVQADLVTGSSSTTVDPGLLGAEVLSSTNWTNASNGLVVDGMFATYTASAQDVLMMRLYSWCGPGGCSSGWNWGDTSADQNAGQLPTGALDNYQLSLTCNGGGSIITVDVAYSWNGVSQGTEWEPQACQATTGAVVYPASPLAYGLNAWQDANYPYVPGIAWQTAQQKYTVTTSGTAVTIASGNGLFSLDPRVLTAGSKITINGTEYTFASINSATTATLTTSAGTQTSVAAYTFNFSVMIRKHSATAGTVNIDGATVRMAMSATWNNGGNGSQPTCSSLTSTDSNGHVGRFCIFVSESNGSGSLFWVTNDLQVRYIGRGLMPASSIGVPADEYVQQSSGYARTNMFDEFDANSWWISTTLVANGLPTLVKGTYNPAGTGGSCTQTANYQPLTIDPNYNLGNMLSCNVTYTELTRPSLGLGINAQLPSIMTSGKFTVGPLLSFVQDGYAFMSLANGQDTEAWVALVNLSTGLVGGTFSTYMNTSSTTGIYPCRACVLHAPVSSEENAVYFGVTTNSYMGGTSTGSGPYDIIVNTALTTTPAMNTTTCLSTVTDTTVNWLLANSSGCDSITLNGSDSIPCDPTPSYWEGGFQVASVSGSGGGSGAVIYAVVSGGTVTGYVVRSGGTGYSGTITIVVGAGPGGGGSGATSGTVTLSGTSISAVAAGSPGSGYTTNAGECSWQNGYSKWQAGAFLPGDWIAANGETLVFLKNTSGTTWIVARNMIGPPHGPEMTVSAGSVIASHSANWTAAIVCNYLGTPAVAVTETNGTGIVWDRWWYGTGHGSYQFGGALGATFYPDISANGLGVRVGALPGAANTAETNRVLNNPAFGPVTGLGQGSYVQSHAGWVGGLPSFTDMSPMAPGTGGVFTLWAQTGVVGPIGGGSSTLYKVPAASAIITPAKRYLAQAVWSGMYNFFDVSGTAAGIGSTSIDNFHYCTIDYPTATCGQAGAGEALGDLFVNIPQASIDGDAGGIFDYNRVNSAPLGMETLSTLQYFYGRLPAGNVSNYGAWERRLSTGGGRYNGQDTYANMKQLGSGLLMFNCGAPNMQRLQDVCLGYTPPDPVADSQPKNNYVMTSIPVVGSAGDTVRISIWYQELNGFFTSRQEQAFSDGSGTNPFVWAGETQHYVSCSTTCTVQIPGISKTHLYYQIHHLNGGYEWTENPPVQIYVP